MEEKEISIRYKVYSNVEELKEQDRILLNEAKNATKSAYAPYSLFNVGSAILLKNGKIITGNNQENVAYPSGLCAERVAMFSASSKYPNDEMIAIAVTANSFNFEVKEPVSPCGSCRQVMSEYEMRQHKPIRVILMGSSGKILVFDCISDLLPFMFNESELKHI